MRLVAAAALLCCFALLPVAAAQEPTVRGVVRDSTGAVVPGAEVETSSGGERATVRTGADGSFQVPFRGPGRLTIRAEHFRTETREVAAAGEVEVTLQAAAAEEITVTASRTAIDRDQTAADVALVSERQIQTSAARALDDVLRQIPGFTLFRRTGSRAANPTAQGVSLRGVGASGASRALVIQDGVPLNDPFGGWVYWNRVPRAQVEAVEVLRGGGSNLYGSDALGGVVNVMAARALQPKVSLETAYGTNRTPDVSAVGSGRAGGWALGAAGEIFRTDGYVLVRDEERGPVDVPANTRYQTGNATVERVFGAQNLLFVRGGLLREDRDNGTRLQTNETRMWHTAAGADWHGDAGDFALRVYGSAQDYRQSFSAISANRASESLTRTQYVPAQQFGTWAQWTGKWGAYTAVAGVETRLVRGESDEIIYSAGAPFTNTVAGGRQQSFGAYLENIFRVGANWVITAGGRADRWNNLRGSLRSIPINRPGAPTATQFADRDESAFSPRVSVLLRPRNRLSVGAAAYRSFRAPTLNELYRAFRVGNVLTRANENLQAERLTGAEATAIFRADGLRVKLTYFWARVYRPIANATLSVTPSLITRQRQNLGRTRSQGLQLDGEWQAGGRVFAGAGYQYTDSEVERFPGNTAVEGRMLPQIAPHQFTFHTRFVPAQAWTLALQGRAGGRQFDDDLNQLPLDGFFTLDAYVSRALPHGIEIFGAVENIFNRRYEVGRTPVITLGPPLLARVGLRLNLPRR